MKRRFGFDKERRDDLLYWHLRLDTLSGQTYGVSRCAAADPSRLGFHVIPGDRDAVANDLLRARRCLREKVRQEDDQWRKRQEWARLDPYGMHPLNPFGGIIA
jgi:hypothetical protein